MRSLRWTLATTVGFVAGGTALHSPGASAVGAAYFEWDVSAAVVGTLFGAIVGALTGLLQLVALGIRSWRLVAASIAAVSVAHALADGAPAVWGVAVVAALSGLCAAAALAWALRIRAWRWTLASSVVWWAGWSLGVAVAGALGLSSGATPDVWATEHAVIAAILGLAWGGMTSPAARRILGTDGPTARPAAPARSG